MGIKEIHKLSLTVLNFKLLDFIHCLTYYSLQNKVSVLPIQKIHYALVFSFNNVVFLYIVTILKFTMGYTGSKLKTYKGCYLRNQKIYKNSQKKYL